jgi:ABC-type transporter MlaC component
MLNAKMKKDQEEFGIYFDLEKLIIIFPSFYKKYTEAPTPSEKTKVIQNFEEYLTTYWGDPIISYTIEKTEIEGQEAKVTANVKFKLRETSYTLKYTYSLYQTYDNRWLIYSYDVVNLK